MIQTSDTFEIAFKFSGIGMALVDRQGRWIDVNDALCNMLEYSKSELLAISFQDITYSDDLGDDLALVRKILKKEIETYGIEKRYISGKGKIVQTRLTVSPVWNDDGSFKFFISQIVDITAKKELIGQLSRKNAELETTQLSLINKLNQLEALNYIIAHNLRGPANNLTALAGLLQQEIASVKSSTPTAGLAESAGIANMIKEGSDALKESLDTLMEVAQIGLNKTIPKENCDIEELVNKILAQHHNVIFEKKAIVNLLLLVPVISYPPIYLESIIYNLISNALKYCRDNVPPRITISTYENDGRTILSVKDNGLGIDLDKYAERIFKLNQIFHEGYDSKGVGLFLTKFQIESMGGSIKVLSKINEGTEFIVTL